MAKYRSKPFEFEAAQWFKDGDHPAVKPTYGGFCVMTRQGTARVDPGDWIITLPGTGETYPCKPDVFEDKYEPVPAEPAETEEDEDEEEPDAESGDS